MKKRLKDPDGKLKLICEIQAAGREVLKLNGSDIQFVGHSAQEKRKTAEIRELMEVTE